MVGICRISLSIKNVWPKMNFRMKDNNSFSPGMDKATHPSGSGEIEVVVYGIGGMWWIDSVHWSGLLAREEFLGNVCRLRF